MKSYKTIRGAKTALGYVGPMTRPACRNCTHCDIRRWAEFSRRAGDHIYYCQLGGFIASEYGHCQCFGPRASPAAVRDVQATEIDGLADYCHA